MIPTGQPSIAVSIEDASIASAFKRLKTPSSVESINSLIPSSLIRKYCGIVSSHKQHPTHSLALCRITTKDVEVLLTAQVPQLFPFCKVDRRGELLHQKVRLL